MDQGQTGSCGGHGTSQGVYTACGASGKPLPFVPSQRTIYSVTRCFERGTSDEPLTDSGIMPMDLVKTVSTIGLQPMLVAASPDGRFSDEWGPSDWTTSVVNDEPDFEGLEISGQTILTGEYRINEMDPTAYDQMASIIGLAKATIGVGLFVDSAFMRWTGAMPPVDSIDTSDPAGGGHWVSVDGYMTQIVGGITQKVFEICNSWGTSAGAGGVYRITERALRMAASDLIPWTVRVAA